MTDDCRLMTAYCRMMTDDCRLPTDDCFSLVLLPIEIPPSFMYKINISLLFIAFIFACAGNTSSNTASAVDGEAIYKKYCTLCHGVDGKLGLNGSKDITISKLTEPERIVQITKGKNTMTPFEGILSPEEIKAVAAYSMTLK